MNPTQPTEIVLSAAEVALLIGVEIYDLQSLHPDDFGVPGHWKMNGTATVVYTEKGVEGLRQVMLGQGKEDEAAALHAALVKLRQERATPSRGLVPPAEKGPWYSDDRNGMG